MSKPPIDEEYAFDPMDPSQSKDFERLARIRRERPVCRPAEGLVISTRYDATKAAFLDAKRFSSLGDMRAPGVVVPEFERFLGEVDAPLHPRIRRILIKGFTRSRARVPEDWTRAEIRRRLDGLVERGRGDLMSELAILIPGAVSAHELGIPDALHDSVMSWCNELLHSTWPSTGKTERGEGIAGGFPELSECIDGLIRERESAGPDAHDDLLSLMVHARTDDGWSIGAHHARTLVVNILAGSLSASYMLGNLFYRLLTDPGFGTALREDAAKIPKAVEETLRFEPPVVFMMRTATEDTEIGGVPVYRGEHVMLSIGAANRDEDVYPDGESFRLDRESPAEHLTFGYGPHLCLGNHLTRMIGRVAIEELMALQTSQPVELAPGFQWTCVPHLLEYGPDELPVVLGR